MRITSLEVQNFKRIRAIDFKPDKHFVELTGENESGKTSTLDAIFVTISGVSDAQPELVRRGAEQAIIKLSTDTLRVTRTFKRGKDGGKQTTSLTVESMDGAVYRSPQTILDTLYNGVALDPLQFARAPASEQCDILKSFVPDVDFDAMEKANREDYSERTIANRKAKEAKAQAVGIVIPQTALGEGPDPDALLADLQNGIQHNAEIGARKERRANAEAEVRRVTDAIAARVDHAARLRSELADVEADIEKGRDQRDALQKRLDEAESLPEPIDVAGLRQQIDDGRKRESKRREIERAKALKEQSLKQEADALALSAKLTRQMEERERERREAIAAAKLPVEGLSLGDDCVLLDGLPFVQASDAVQLKTSVAIAAAMNPQLRVIRIRDGSLLDNGNMALLTQFAQENDFQIWIETVRSDRPGAIHIVDGRIAAGEAEEDGDASSVDGSSGASLGVGNEGGDAPS